MTEYPLIYMVFIGVNIGILVNQIFIAQQLIMEDTCIISFLRVQDDNHRNNKTYPP